MTMKYIKKSFPARRFLFWTKMIIYMEIYISFVNFGC